ncbi:FecR family protein [Chitinophaga qingshengii]|uniref:FecR domain-containing protein n=1 Tax=Chitinophaga qingshengii TaxID=1569794 RepID=A0ABR7TH96_9BACT|nr:FecR family protein [Chitinophaga qingshengii]MBC9928886.1 FecR domain-containing protein [Chitinophaga qingshengii]
MNQNRLEYLFNRYAAGQITPEELREFDTLVQQPENESAFKSFIDQLLRTTSGTAAMPEEAIQATLQHITGKPASSSVVRYLRRSWWAAAAGFLLLGSSIYLITRPRHEAMRPLADKAPGSSKAVLTLADGSTIALDSSGQQVISQQQTAIRQSGGQLQYTVQAPGAGNGYNTLTTPRGGQFRVILPDGTAVWLNTASALRYPTAFTGADRTVELQGEAYFEVAANATQPFRVRTAAQEIQVLGTSFNINAYTNEGYTVTTLVTGRVKVNAPGKDAGIVLEPGQQAIAAHNGSQQLSFARAIAPDVIAWKNGLFLFDNADLETVMRCLERWYDVEVKYEAKPDIHYTGQIARNEPLSKVVHMLEQTGQARFRLVRAGQGHQAKDMIIILE